MENAVVYARYSSHNQTEMSIDGQVDAAKTYAAQNGLNIIHVYADRAKTGTNDKRPEFQQMLEDCKRHKFTVIIVWKVDRFGRNKEEIIFNKYKCKKEGVRVLYVAESIGAGNEAVILESVLEGMAEYYSKQLSTNVKRGQAVAKAKGHWHGGNVPYGFMVVDKKLEVDPVDGPVVENIFRRYADGDAVAQIAEDVDRCRSSIFAMVQDEKYKGVICPPDVWNRVQHRIKTRGIRRTTKEEHRREYILTSKLYCSCGRKMVGSYGCSTKYKYYFCAGKKKGSGCTSHNLKKEETEQLIMTGLRKGLGDPEKIVDSVWAQYQEYVNRPKDESKQALEAIEIADKGIANIMKAVEQGMDYSLVKERLETLQRQKEEAEQDLLDQNRRHDLKITKDEIRKYLKDSLSTQDPIVLLDRYVNRINYSDEGFEILLNVSSDFRINVRWPGRIVLKAKK